MAIRLTYTTALVLQTLGEEASYGFDIMETTGLPGGTVYPVLRRLEAADLVRGDWEPEHEARQRRRPNRRLYTLTPAGEQVLAEALERFPRLARITGAALPEHGS